MKVEYKINSIRIRAICYSWTKAWSERCVLMAHKNNLLSFFLLFAQVLSLFFSLPINLIKPRHNFWTRGSFHSLFSHLNGSRQKPLRSGCPTFSQKRGTEGGRGSTAAGFPNATKEINKKIDQLEQDWTCCACWAASVLAPIRYVQVCVKPCLLSSRGATVVYPFTSDPHSFPGFSNETGRNWFSLPSCQQHLVHNGWRCVGQGSRFSPDTTTITHHPNFFGNQLPAPIYFDSIWSNTDPTGNWPLFIDLEEMVFQVLSRGRLADSRTRLFWARTWHELPKWPIFV